MKFCSECGNGIVVEVPKGDNRPRHVCPSCQTIHYHNPRIVAGTLPTYQGRILLCRRAIEPRQGYWTLPAGFMELGESVAEAAARETWEEAEARVNMGPLYTVINIPYIGQVHIFYLADIRDGEYGAGLESLESRLFAPEEIPWEALAFRSVKLTLEKYLDDRKLGVNALQSTEMTLEIPPEWKPSDSKSAPLDHLKTPS
ncbi:MAG: NUDIX hydrolase [Hahellaceae bacterium]|nr:NUDIX hydrolase [Hahellaceae bacterium]